MSLWFPSGKVHGSIQQADVKKHHGCFVPEDSLDKDRINERYGQV